MAVQTGKIKRTDKPDEILPNSTKILQSRFSLARDKVEIEFVLVDKLKESIWENNTYPCS